MTRRAIGAAVAAAICIALGPSAMAGGSLTELLEVCQNEEAAPKTRIEACTGLINDASVDADVRAEALLNRGIAQEEAGDDAVALADYTKAIELNPEYPAFFGYRGMLYEKLGRHEEAIKDASEVLRLLPGDYDALHSRARSRYVLGQIKEALADYTTLISQDAKDLDALVGRGNVYEDLGRKNEAVADFRAALKVDATSEEAKEGLARLKAK